MEPAGLRFAMFLTSSDLQFGFKKNLGCSHALFAFNETVRYFINNNSHAFGAFLDISKAFDKVLHNGMCQVQALKLARFWRLTL